MADAILINADLRDADALRAENEELRCRVDEMTEEIGELRLQLDERLREWARRGWTDITVNSGGHLGGDQ